MYRKPTHTERYLHFDSYHPPDVKTGIIQTLVHRSKVNSENHVQEIKHLTNAMVIHKGLSEELLLERNHHKKSG